MRFQLIYTFRKKRGFQRSEQLKIFFIYFQRLLEKNLFCYVTNVYKKGQRIAKLCDKEGCKV